MDDFLTKLYEDEMVKTSAAELDNFMDSLSREELEGLLGIDKLAFVPKEKKAVAGPTEAPLPDSLPGKELDARQQAIEEYATKSRTDTPPTREQAEEATAVNHQGPGKEPTTKEAMAWADSVGRMLAKTAAGGLGQHLAQKGKMLASLATIPVIGGGIGALASPEGEALTGAKRGALTGAGAYGGTLAGMGLGGLGGAGLGAMLGRMKSPAGAAAGAGIGALSGLLGGGIYGGVKGGKAAHRWAKKRNPYAEERAALGKESQGMDEGMGGMGGMETTAAVKAKIASRAMRVTAGAPPHIKQAAAKFAAMQIVAACKRAQGPGEEGEEEKKENGNGMKKEDEFTTPEAQAKAKVMSRALKIAKGDPTNVRKATVSMAAKEMKKVGTSPFG